MLMLKAIFNISMYVCCCLAVTDSEIDARIASGASSVEAVMACTGAGSRCGSCRSEIAQMVRDHHQHSAPRAAQSESGLRSHSDGRVHLTLNSEHGPMACSPERSENESDESLEERRLTDSQAPASAA